LAKKQKKTEVKRLPTKQQLSKWERQKKIQRIIVITGAIFFALIIAFVGYGYYDARVRPFQQQVLKVNDATIDMNYYLEWLDVSLRGVDAARAPVMADMVLERILQGELIVQRSSKLGVTIKESDIDSEIAKMNLPDKRIYRVDYAANVLHDKLMSEYFEQKVPVAAKQVNAQAMFLESLEAASQVADRIGDGESFIKLAKEFSVEDFTKEKSGELGWLLPGLSGLASGKFSNSQLGDIAFSTAAGTVSKPTYDPSVIKAGGYWLLEVTEKDKDQSSHIRGILLGSDSEALEVKSKLKAGADFAALAKDKSQHLESKEFAGDLGWKQKAQATDVIGKAAFELSINVLSDPIRDSSVRTKGGYWLVKVAELNDNRQIDKEIREQLKSKAFDDWVQEERKSSTIERYLTEDLKAWAIDYTLKNMGSVKK
jgi:parvulin-like peptidyl-prolyl isomerase